VKVFILYVGKPRDAGLNAFAEEYVKRTTRWAKVEMREIPAGRDDWWDRNSAAYKVLLDPAGRVMDSGQFTAMMERLEREARDTVFVIGGADGLPEAWKKRADLLLSVSAMTFPHELARAILAEQIYRAWATLKGHPYPR
jgi:23S rRNA (pseudouridine1915-N3)-methyltransferase